MTGLWDVRPPRRRVPRWVWWVLGAVLVIGYYAYRLDR